MSLLPLPSSVRVVVLGEGVVAGQFWRAFDDAGCSVEPCSSTDTALTQLEREPARLIVVIESEKADLTAVVRALRAHDGAPVLALARGGEEARLEAFEAGADDVVSVLTSEREVLTRAAALLRRTLGTPRRKATFGGLTLDLSRHTAEFEGRAVPLTAYEFALLKVLATHAGNPVSREELLSVVKGSLDASFERSIDVHICRLRRKLGAVGPLHLKTVRGVGYVFDHH